MNNWQPISVQACAITMLVSVFLAFGPFAIGGSLVSALDRGAPAGGCDYGKPGEAARGSPALGSLVWVSDEVNRLNPQGGADWSQATRLVRAGSSNGCALSDWSRAPVHPAAAGITDHRHHLVFNNANAYVTVELTTRATGERPPPLAVPPGTPLTADALRGLSSQSTGGSTAVVDAGVHITRVPSLGRPETYRRALTWTDGGPVGEGDTGRALLLAASLGITVLLLTAYLLFVWTCTARAFAGTTAWRASPLPAGFFVLGMSLVMIGLNVATGMFGDALHSARFEDVYESAGFTARLLSSVPAVISLAALGNFVLIALWRRRNHRVNAAAAAALAAAPPPAGSSRDLLVYMAGVGVLMLILLTPVFIIVKALT